VDERIIDAVIERQCSSGRVFFTPAQTDFGNIPPNSFRGPGFFDVDTQLTGRIPVTERAAFELRLVGLGLLLADMLHVVADVLLVHHGNLIAVDLAA